MKDGSRKDIPPNKKMEQTEGVAGVKAEVHDDQRLQFGVSVGKKGSVSNKTVSSLAQVRQEGH